MSFAIISDRIFKTAPEAVSDWEGRHDHMQEPREDLSFLDKPGVDIIGENKEREAITGLKTQKGTNSEKVLVEL